MSKTPPARFRKFPVLALSLVMAATMFCALSSSADEDLRTTCGSAIPLALLPSRVPAPQGELTLYADYTARRGEFVVLYLINRTDQDLEFSAQDSDIYVKLETLNEAGYWERAQRHGYSDCGNSYFYSPRLNAGHFFKFLGYSPRDGERRTVRYRMHQDAACVVEGEDRGPIAYLFKCEQIKKIRLVSNQAIGFVLSEELERCRRDRLSATTGCFEVVARIATDLSIPFYGKFHDAGRSTAIGTLRRFGDDRALAVLQRLLDDEDERIRNASVEAIARMASKLKPAGTLHETLLNDEDPVIRASAIGGLAFLPHVETLVPYLEGLLEDPELRVRGRALFVLIGLARECEEAFALVEGLADDPDPDIQKIVEVNLRILDEARADPEQYERSEALWDLIRKRDDL